MSESGFQVSVIYSPEPRKVQCVMLTVIGTCTVLQALQRSGLLSLYPEIDNQHILVGVWGRKESLDHLLRDQDRVEVYRPLRVDPKVARRERFVKQGSRSAGLFTKKCVGSKTGD